MKAEVPAVMTPSKLVAVSVPKLPPRPIWTDQIGAFLDLAQGFTCNSREDFETAKALSQKGTDLKKQITESYAPLTQAIDAIKAPILEQRNKDTSMVESWVGFIDTAATGWKQEQDRIAKAKRDAELEAERKRKEEARQAELKRLEDAKQKEIELANEWGDAEEAHRVAETPVHVPEIIPPRDSKVNSDLTYRKGVSTKKKLLFQVENPDEVNRQYCCPDPGMIRAKVANWVKNCPNPTREQIEAIEKEIGGGRIVME